MIFNLTRLIKNPIENIKDIAKWIAIMPMIFINSVYILTKLLTSAYQIIEIKLVNILVVLCKSTHHNNSNYFLFLIPLYLYSSVVRVKIITLFNDFCINILYNIFQ